MNIKNIFFVSLLILLLVGITAVSAADDTTDATISESHQTADSLQVQELANDNSVKTLTKKTSKNVKENTTNSVDYYVSDTTGSDTNNGTEDSPFKTIQTAIDKTKTGKTNNIYIKAGLYKGIGNTNLTVDGDKTINFIGEGKEQTEFDGEAGFDIVNDGTFFWGSSDIWHYYDNETGNWFMNITYGKGKISINNISINHMYSIGLPGQYWHGDSISLYPTTTVDNYGNLEINNVQFYQNYGGVGSAIRNNDKATLTINNSEFAKNQKSSSSGNEGIIYNNGTATILNSYFHDNYARWGTVLNDYKLIVENTLFKDNKGYDGSSTFKYGAGIAFNSGASDYHNQYEFSRIINTEVYNSTFINQNQTSLYGQNGNLILSGCNFTDTTGIRLIDDTNDNNNYTIQNNTFNNIIGSYIDYSMSHDEADYFVLDLSINSNNVYIYDNNFINNKGAIITTNTGKIRNNSIRVNDEAVAVLLRNPINNKINNLTKDIIIENNTLYSQIVNKISNVLITNNKIITTSNYTINSTNTNSNVKNITVIDNYLVSSSKIGNDAVLKTDVVIVENNSPTYSSDCIFCSPDVTEANEGTMDNPTTIYDAITKINNNATIILLPGSTNSYVINTTMNINEETVKENTITFKITALDSETLFSSTTCAFNISENYEVTLSNITITNNTSRIVNNSGTFNLVNVYIINNKCGSIINNLGSLNIIDSVISNNSLGVGYINIPMMSNTGLINFIGNCYISQNSFAPFIKGGNLCVNGTNTIYDQKSQLNGAALFDGNSVIIDGNNIFKNIGNDIVRPIDLTINGNNIFVNNSGIQSMFGTIAGMKGNLTINGENIFENNSYGRLALFKVNDIVVTINGSNIFRNTIKTNGNLIDNQKTNSLIIINGSNIFENNLGQKLLVSSGNFIINGSNIFRNNNMTSTSLITSSGNELNIVGNNIFDNNTGINGGTIQFTGIKLTITGENTFSNNTGKKGGAIYLTNINNDEAKAIISGNTFINNIAEEGGAIYLLNQSETYTRILEITNNKFINTYSENETLNIPTNNETIIEGNIYENCSIGLTDFTISSELEGQTLVQNTLIPLNISAGLLHPEYYDDNLMENLTYEIYVNDNLKQETPEENTNITEGYIAETDGILNIYAKMNKISNQTNNITVTIIKPLNTTIEVTVPEENTVNKTTPMTIIFLDEEGNIIKDAVINMTTSEETKEVTLVNGAIVYDFTPVTVGNTTVNFVFVGNATLNPTETEVIVNVVADRDAIIEELNNTVQEQNETINNLNNTVNSQDRTIQELEQNMTDANNKIDSLNNNITNLNNQVKDLTNENKQLKNNLTTANNKINAQDKQIQDLNKSLADANKAIQDANKQIKDLNSTVAKLNDQIKNLTTPVDTKVTINTITAVKYSSDVKITGTLTDKAGNAIKNTAVTLNINGKTSNVATDNKGTYTYTGKATTVGTNNVTVQYTATDKYNAAKATSTFKVNKQDLKITINNITSDAYKEDVTVTGVFTDATGKGLSNTNINLTINGKTVKVRTTTGGLFTYTTKATKVGTNNLTVSYAGNANYNKATTKTTFKVVKQDLIVTIDNLDDVRFKENITISGKFVDGNAKPIGNTKLTINLNGKKYTVKTNAQGVYKRSIRVTQIDTNNVTVTYNGNANYNKCTAKATFKALKQNLGITLDSVKTENGKITVTGTFTDEESKPLMNSNVKVTINGKTYTAKTNNKGVYTLTKAYTGNNITLTLSYPGNKNYNSFTKTTKLTV